MPHKLRIGRKQSAPAVFQPVCIQCTGKMEFVLRKPYQSRRNKFERHTFRCEKCGNEQTYTMGTSDRRLMEIWGNK